MTEVSLFIDICSDVKLSCQFQESDCSSASSGSPYTWLMIKVHISRNTSPFEKVGQWWSSSVQHLLHLELMQLQGPILCWMSLWTLISGENDLYQNTFTTLKFVKCPNFVKFSSPDRGHLAWSRNWRKTRDLKVRTQNWLRLNLTFLQNSNFRLKIFSS